MVLILHHCKDDHANNGGPEEVHFHRFKSFYGENVKNQKLIFPLAGLLLCPLVCFDGSSPVMMILAV